MPKIVNEENFEEEVIKSDLPVIADFNATWCGPCRKLAPVVDEIEEMLAGRAKFVSIDADTNRDILIKYSVGGLPTLMVFKSGEPVERMTGLMPKSTIVANIEKHL